MLKKAGLILLGGLICTGSMEAAMKGQYGVVQKYEKGKAIGFPDFDLTYLGSQTRTEPRPITKEEFQISQGNEKRVVPWSSGAGDIAPTEFQWQGKTYWLELQLTHAGRHLAGNEVLISLRPETDQGSKSFTIETTILALAAGPKPPAYFQVDMDPKFWLRTKILNIKPEMDAPMAEGATIVFGIHSPIQLFHGGDTTELINQRVTFGMGWNASKSEITEFNVIPHGYWDTDRVIKIEKATDGPYYRVEFAMHAQVYRLDESHPRVQDLLKIARDSAKDKKEIQVQLTGNTVVDLKP